MTTVPLKDSIVGDKFYPPSQEAKNNLKKILSDLIVAAQMRSCFGGLQPIFLALDDVLDLYEIKKARKQEPEP